MSNAPKPFTYQHFDLALKSFKDEYFMCYIDYAVAIYCRLRGISVGPRPARVKDYSQKYSDAFHVANSAIAIVAHKIGAYDPSKGGFKPYLDTALENAVKDVLKEEGRGDFFDQTSKKKNKMDEPEKHFRVDVDQFRGQVDQDSEPDNSEEERAERVRKFQDEWLETMIRYIDGLSDVKRAAIYASAFGKALRPDLTDYGRNYADIIAQRYNSTAQSIRKTAAEGKAAALAEAERYGYNKRSMGEISIGFLQAKVNRVPDINEKVIQATTHLSPIQQFLFLRHLASKVEESEQ